MKKYFNQWQASFFAGLAVVLPAVLSIAVVLWLFGTIANLTDTLLVFIPVEITQADEGKGPMHWYWSVFALALAALIITLIGSLARVYLGRQIITMVDQMILKVPLLNKVYGAIKQVNDAFATNKNSSFKQVVMVEFPKDGVYSIGFITGDQNQEVQSKTKEKVVSVFVPTTPNPTTGFLILVPEHKVTKLDMEVADGIKFIISLGSVAPEYKGKPAGMPEVAIAQPSGNVPKI
ncbi:MAG: DUF502 domain-containing protein [Verrucomicrobiota bacterium]